MTAPGLDELDPRLLELMRRFFEVAPEIVEGARVRGMDALARDVQRASTHAPTSLEAYAAAYLLLAEHEDDLAKVIASSSRLLAAFGAIETIGNRAVQSLARENTN